MYIRLPTAILSLRRLGVKRDDRYLKLSAVLKSRYGERVFKVNLKAGFDCPNRDGTLGRGGCIYCNDSSFQPLLYRPGQSLAVQLSEGVEYIARRHSCRRVIAYLQDRSATYAPVPELRRIYSEALRHPAVVGLVVGTRPDCLDDETVELLEGLRASASRGGRGLLWVELGLQSASDRSLRFINRCHDVRCFVDAVERLHAAGVAVCAHVILGLPGETMREFRRSVELLAELGVWGVKYHNLQVLHGTRLERMWEEGSFQLPSLEEYVEWLVELVRFMPARMVVHRICASSPERLIAAPMWSVNSHVVRNMLEKRLEEEGIVQGMDSPVESWRPAVEPPWSVPRQGTERSSRER